MMELARSQRGSVSVKVWGEFACFTRPEFGVERVSYPTMTPTAAVGILDAIFWKPEFRWRVTSIDTLKPVQWIQVRRNEIDTRQTRRTAISWAQGDDPGLDIATCRTQRSTLLLYDVAYVIHAWAQVRSDVRENNAKFHEQLRRRVQHGQCHERPYLGCREFVAEFGPVSDDDKPTDWTEDLGSMVLSVYTGDEDPHKRGEAIPVFFHASVKQGRLVEQGQLRVPSLPQERR